MIQSLSQPAASSCLVNCGRLAVFFHCSCNHCGHFSFPDGFSSHTRRSRAAFAAGVWGMGSPRTSACLTLSSALKGQHGWKNDSKHTCITHCSKIDSKVKWKKKTALESSGSASFGGVPFGEGPCGGHTRNLLGLPSRFCGGSRLFAARAAS